MKSKTQRMKAGYGEVLYAEPPVEKLLDALIYYGNYLHIIRAAMQAQTSARVLS